MTHPPEKTPQKTPAMLSPFRYPGGKIWLRPFIRQWLKEPIDKLIECFAGGANVTLTAISENLTKKALIVEIDPDVAAVWDAVLNGKADWLCDKIESFNLNRRTVQAELQISPRTTHTRAWKTLLRNRVNHGGILAPGAGLLRRGEDDNGLGSRWYPDTLTSRIKQINKVKNRITIIEADALTQLEKYKTRHKGTLGFFIDPPYSSVGERLYTYSEVDHEELFKTASQLPGRVLMTYQDADEVHELVRRFGFKYRRVKMLNRQNAAKTELLVCKDFGWLRRR